MYKLTLEYIKEGGILPKGFIRYVTIEDKNKFNTYMGVLNTNSWKILSIDVIETKPIKYLNRVNNNNL